MLDSFGQALILPQNYNTFDLVLARGSLAFFSVKVFTTCEAILSGDFALDLFVYFIFYEYNEINSLVVFFFPFFLLFFLSFALGHRFPSQTDICFRCRKQGHWSADS